MMLPYLLRLSCLCLACFYIVHTALALVASGVSPTALRHAERLKPRKAARLLFALRIFPTAASVLAVGALCVPSYLWLEPAAARERVGVACISAALLGTALWAISAVRTLRASVRSFRFAKLCQRWSSFVALPDKTSPVLVVESESPLLAMAGVFRPQVVISLGVLDALSPEQLDAALRHEQAHGRSRDNLKRLLLLLAPGMASSCSGLAALERGWAKFAERAADDRAVQGDSLLSVSLASALVRVARMGAAPRVSPLLMSLVPDRSDLSERVNRLLHPRPPRELPDPPLRVAAAGVVCVVTSLFAILLLRPETFYAVHALLERLVR